ncbi:MAG: NAD+ synthase [Methylococcaceae bacterium]|nr:NAD+ synthase [Methylococcaceae bacterium]
MLKIALAQVNLLVGGIKANQKKIIQTSQYARDELKADLIIFPELSITGYPPEDLLLRPDFINHANQTIVEIADAVSDIDIVIGFPELDHGNLYNSAGVLRDGKVLTRYKKNVLPNFGVFDEQRYFKSSNQNCIFTLKGSTIALTICEDIWKNGLIEKNKQAGADIIITLNASPFYAGKIHQREEIVCQQVKQTDIPLVYVNAIGGQDELVFDGASFVVNAQGNVVFRAEEFEEQVAVVEFEKNVPIKNTCAPLYNIVSSEYKALVLGVRDYVYKNGFKGAILGLSGGIDSALVLAIAVDALGADQVEAVLMPSKYTQNMSNEDAILEAKALGIKYHTIAIEPAVKAFTDMLSEVFAGIKRDATEENIQARCRGVLLMAMSNKQGKLLLTTGNKSEMSVGYATLYGDMAGGFAPIKDVPKLLVYQLAEYRNTLSDVIPERVITRPPSAELAPDQIDEDSLPPYSVLDPILEMYIEQDKSAKDILEAGYQIKDINRAISLVDRNEYKRRQAPPGIKITPRAFGRDRRYPITSGYKGIIDE